MRDNIKSFVRMAAERFDLLEPIFEFGSFQVREQLGYADLRPFFPGRAYVGCDMREGPGVDRILDLHAIDQSSDSVGTVLCLDTLEHVEEPRRAVEEIFRILKPGGILVISSVMCFPIHDHPFDYWRFTPEAFRSLLKPFAGMFVGFQGEKDFPHTVIGIGFKGATPGLREFERAYLHWKGAEPGQDRLVAMARRVIPPILVPLLSAAYRSLLRRSRGSG